MRAAILTILLSSTPALGWDGPGWSPWSLSVEERRDGISYNASVTFTRVGKAWRVEASCTAVDPANKAFLTQRGTGVAKRSEGGLRADVQNLDGFYVDGTGIVWGTMLCPSGPYHVGTAD